MTTPYNPSLGRCPVVFYPSVVQAVTDWNFAAGSFGVAHGKFQTNGGAVPTIVTGSGAYGNAVRFAATATDSFIYNFGDPTNVITLPTDGAPLWLYHRTRGVSGSGVFNLKINWYNGGGFFASEDHNYTLGTDIPLDGIFRTYRLAITPPGGSLAYSMEIGKRDFTTSETWLNWFYLGHAVDLQDNDTSPAFFTECAVDSRWEQEFNEAEDASVKGPGWSPPVQRGAFKSSEVGFGMYQLWRQFYAVAKTGTPWSFFRAPGDLTQEHELAAVLRQDHDGAEAVKGRKTYTFGAAWSGVPLGAVATAPDNRVVEIAGLVGGTGSAYFASASVPGIPGSAANVLPVLDPKRTTLGEQVLDDLEGTTEFPALAVTLADQGQAVIALLAANLRTAWQNPVFLWEGQAGASFSTYQRRFAGFLDAPDQIDSDGLSFTLSALSQFDRLKQAVDFLPGACQLKSAITTSAAGAYLVKQAVNLELPAINRIATAAPDESSFESGTDGATPTGWTTPDGTPKLFRQSSRDTPLDGSKVMRNTDASAGWHEVYKEYPLAKLGNIFTFQVSVLTSDGSGSAPFQLIVEGRTSGGTLVDSVECDYVQDVDREAIIGDGTIPFWQGYSCLYEVTDPTVKTLRCRIRSNNTDGQTGMEFDLAKVAIATFAVIDREVVAVADLITHGKQKSYLNFTARGCFGSQPMNHDADAELYRIVALRGHPLDLMRRLITTSLWVGRGAWSNATAYKRDQYDSSSGARLGADSVTYGGAQWRCLLDHTNQTPAEGVYWTQVSDYDAGDGFGLGDYFPAYLLNDAVWQAERNWKSTGSPGEFADFDFSKYRYDLRVDAKIDNLLKFLEEEFLKPLHANLYQDEHGLLCIRLHRAQESAGAAWSSGTAYAVGDYATNAGLSWRCVQAHTNQTPAEGAYWTRNTLGKADLFNAGKLFKYRYNLDRLCNAAVFQFDHDPHGAVDVQGNKTAGGTKFLSQVYGDEVSLGHDPDDSAARSLQLYGMRQLELASRGIRGTTSARLGLSSNLGGDQLVREVFRRIITRCRHPLQEYDVEADWVAQTIAPAHCPQVTSDAMTNLFGSAGNYRKRIAASMQVYRRGVNGATGRLTLGLRAVQDVVAIPNTHAAGAASAPTSNEFRAILRNKTNATFTDPLYFQGANWDDAGMAYQPMALWPKGKANVVWVTLFAGASSAPTSTSTPTPWTSTDHLLTRVYAARKIFTATTWSSATAYAVGDLVVLSGNYWRCLTANTNHSPAENSFWTADLPLAGEYELVAEIPKGATDGYFVGFSCSTSAFGTSRTYVKIANVNLDHVETAACFPLQVATPNAPVNHGTRFPHKEYGTYTADRAGERNRF